MRKNSRPHLVPKRGPLPLAVHASALSLHIDVCGVMAHDWCKESNLRGRTAIGQTGE
jgi:hypothetical protein